MGNFWCPIIFYINVNIVVFHVSYGFCEQHKWLIFEKVEFLHTILWYKLVGKLCYLYYHDTADLYYHDTADVLTKHSQQCSF